MKEADSRKAVNKGKFTAKREFFRPGRQAMFSVSFQECTGGFLQHCLTIAEGMTEQRAVELAESLNRAIGLEMSEPS